MLHFKVICTLTTIKYSLTVFPQRANHADPGLLLLTAPRLAEQRAVEIAQDLLLRDCLVALCLVVALFLARDAIERRERERRTRDSLSVSLSLSQSLSLSRESHEELRGWTEELDEALRGADQVQRGLQRRKNAEQHPLQEDAVEQQRKRTRRERGRGLRENRR